ncbi:hypothetical protein KC360_g6691 [Hortaea werneckii]|nr:hypothetical protein KC361_g6982 [Hortaea werneckii]KAI6883375.1 hypothetical protein KC325_g5102 [Hortaea werneckii]KAI6994926.1 hypothetical protein KC359_g4333 [Hortaea werneckii]KAI7143046.1 hypothetical protein KC344_g6636 [Hortaea werneckii]KAI7170594.1 hypothetical protein KC360_g6691 [Hortaea werneckii]
MNVTSSPMTKELVLFAAENYNMTEETVIQQKFLGITMTIASALRAATWLGSAAGAVSTGIGCFDLVKSAANGEQVTDDSKTSCILGAAGTVIGFGTAGASKYFTKKAAAAAAARAAALPPNLPPLELGSNFRQAMELTRFGGTPSKRHPWKRGLEERGVPVEQEWDQYFHNDFTEKLIRDSNVGEGVFLGYNDDAHQLSRRDGVHPLAPRFKFEHPKRGPMVLSTMFTNTTAHITVEPWIQQNPTISKRWQEEYRKEVLDNKRLVEGRFDHEAANADPADISVDAKNTFQAAEDSLHCSLKGKAWPLDHVSAKVSRRFRKCVLSGVSKVFDVQVYDDTNRATIGYASVGIFDDHGHDDDLGNLQPQPPIVGGESC